MITVDTFDQGFARSNRLFNDNSDAEKMMGIATISSEKKKMQILKYDMRGDNCPRRILPHRLRMEDISAISAARDLNKGTSRWKLHDSQTIATSLRVNNLLGP